MEGCGLANINIGFRELSPQEQERQSREKRCSDLRTGWDMFRQSMTCNVLSCYARGSLVREESYTTYKYALCICEWTGHEMRGDETPA